MNPHAQPQPYLTSGERKCFLSHSCNFIEYYLEFFPLFFFFFFLPRTGLFFQVERNEAGKQTVYKHSSSKDQMKTRAFRFRVSLFAFGIEASSATFSRALLSSARRNATSADVRAPSTSAHMRGEEKKKKPNKPRPCRRRRWVL